MILMEYKCALFGFPKERSSHDLSRTVKGKSQRLLAPSRCYVYSVHILLVHYNFKDQLQIQTGS